MSKKYTSEEYFSVINKNTGKKIVDCAEWSDAMMMLDFDAQNRAITRNKFLMGQVIDIEMPKALPTNEVVHVSIDTTEYKNHQDKWMVDKLKQLQQSDLIEFTGE